MNVFDIDMRFQPLKDAIDAILQRFPAHPVNNQPAPVVAVQGKSFLFLNLIQFTYLFVQLLLFLRHHHAGM
jgi:hypothetical protein